MDRATWAELDVEQRRATLRTEVAALRAVPDHRHIAAIVTALGGARREDAVPVLAQLWEDCAVPSIRTAAGHALAAIGSVEAQLALIGSLHDPDPFATSLAVRAIFDAEPRDAFDCFEPYFREAALRAPGGGAVASAVLDVLSPDAFTDAGPRWFEPRVPRWLRDEPRWLALAARLRNHPVVGARARFVLRHAGVARAEAVAA
jgi:hypothetical protein